MKKKKDIKQIVIYQAPSGAIELRGDIGEETIWATQAQIAEVFQAERSVITKHIRNILKDKELDADSVCAKFAHTADDGKTYYVQFYNLDVILAVGYRTNSKRAIEFRKWATKTLREHITRGYTINRKQIAKNYEAFMKAVSDIQALLPEHITLDPKAILELVKEFSSTWMSLNAYDKDALTIIGTTKKSIALSGKALSDALANFRLELMRSGSATEIFAQERAKGSIEGIVGNVMQSFDGKPMYKSVEDAKGEGKEVPQYQSADFDRSHALYSRKRSKEKRTNGRIGNTIIKVSMTQSILIITPLESVPIPSPLASYGVRIDQLVYKLYGLTPEEIRIVEFKK